MPQFTTQNAREMHRKSRESFARNAALRALKPKTPQIVAFQPATAPQKPANDYVEERLSRIRKHIEQVDRMFRSELDPARLSKLARALSDLAEVERKLAGRPLPGALRPRSRGAATSTIAEPVGVASVFEPSEPAVAIGSASA